MAAALLSLVLAACERIEPAQDIAALEQALEAREFDAVITQAPGLLARAQAAGAEPEQTARIVRAELLAMAGAGRMSLLLERLAQVPSAAPVLDTPYFMGELVHQLAPTDPHYQSVPQLIEAARRRFPEQAAAWSEMNAYLANAAPHDLGCRVSSIGCGPSGSWASWSCRFDWPERVASQ